MLSQCQHKAAEHNLVFMNMGTEGTCGGSGPILIYYNEEDGECTNLRMAKRRGDRRVYAEGRLKETKGPE